MWGRSVGEYDRIFVTICDPSEASRRRPFSPAACRALGFYPYLYRGPYPFLCPGRLALCRPNRDRHGPGSNCPTPCPLLLGLPRLDMTRLFSKPPPHSRFES